MAYLRRLSSALRRSSMLIEFICLQRATAGRAKTLTNELAVVLDRNEIDRWMKTAVSTALDAGTPIEPAARASCAEIGRSTKVSSACFCIAATDPTRSRHLGSCQRSRFATIGALQTSVGPTPSWRWTSSR